MATSAEDQLYPLSTEDGKHVPLEVIRPLGVFVRNVPAAGAAVALPAYYDLVSVVSTVDAVWTFSGSSIVEDADIPLALMLHKDTLITAVIPAGATHFIKPLETADGVVKIQAIQRWAGLALNRQLVRR